MMDFCDQTKRKGSQQQVFLAQWNCWSAHLILKKLSHLLNIQDGGWIVAL